MKNYGYNACTANSGKTGANGTDSSDSVKTLDSSKYPYNTITFTGAKSSEQTVNYYLTQTDSITAPAYDESKRAANQIFTGWKVTTTATKLPDAFGESSSVSTLTGTGVENYDITIASEVNASIEKLTAEFTWKNTELIYNGTEQVPTAELNDIPDADKESCKVTVTGGKTDSNAKTNTESYMATASIDNANYELKNTTVTFTIAQKSIKDAVINLTPGDVLHTGAEFTQTVDSVKLDGVALRASDYEAADSSIFNATDFGVYTITLNGTGNYKDSVSKEWRIKDENPSTGEISIAENKWNSFWNGVTFGHFFKETQKVTINASDEGSGVDKVYYYNSNVILSLDEVKALADGEWKTIKNGGSYNLDADKVTVNGNKTALTDGKYIIKADTGEDASEQQKYTILAEDKAGNKTELTITLRKSHNEVPYEDVKATCTKDGHTGGSYCSACSEVIQASKNTDALGHRMPVDWTVEKEATASEEGLRSKTCEREGCGYKMYQNIPVTGASDIGSLDKYAEVAPDALVKKALFDNKKSDILSGDSNIFTSVQYQNLNSLSSLQKEKAETGRYSFHGLHVREQTVMTATGHTVMENRTLRSLPE